MRRRAAARHYHDKERPMSQKQERQPQPAEQSLRKSSPYRAPRLARVGGLAQVRGGPTGCRKDCGGGKCRD